MENKFDYLEEIGGELVIKSEFLTKLAELKKAKEDAEKELKKLTGGIVNELKTQYTDTTRVGNYNLVFKGGTYGVVFDEETFKRENIVEYIKYLKPAYSTPTSALVSAVRTKKGE